MKQRPGDRGVQTHLAGGEDCRALAATLADPQGAGAPGETILFEATMVELQ